MFRIHLFHKHYAFGPFAEINNSGWRIYLFFILWINNWVIFSTGKCGTFLNDGYC
jgi:hypothetical protein